MHPMTIINLILFAGLLGALFHLGRTGRAGQGGQSAQGKGREVSLAYRVLAGLIGGVIFGFYLQFGFGFSSEVSEQTLEWTNVIANVYVNLLRMIIMPLVLITMIAAVLKVQQIRTLGRVGGSVVAVLIVTTMIAASIGMFMAGAFGLNADELTQGALESDRMQELQVRRESVANLGLAEMIVSLFPRNVFADLTDARDTSIIAVVIFGLIFGVAALLVSEENRQHGERINGFVDTVQAVIMKLVRMVMNLTPYGVLALMTRVVAGSDGGAIYTLIGFVIASYIAIMLMFGVHALLLSVAGVNLRRYFSKVWPVLSFAFLTRSSAATIPLSIRAMIEELKLPVPVSNIAASFGSTIGQNGCAGIYPAMLAVMVAPGMGVEIDAGFIASLLLIIAIGSFGIAGVGGGATNAALVVLPAMGFPFTVAALLISIEPLIDMARTALNVNGAITSGVITSRLLGREIEAAGDAA